MRISQLAISKYRAFDQKVMFPLSDLTVLTGPNNLGKSTVLSALNLLFGPIRRSPHDRYLLRKTYEYNDDYPKRYQGRPGRRWPTRFEVSLELSAADKQLASQELNLAVPDSAELTLEFRLDETRDNLFRPNYELKGFSPDQDQQKFIRWITERVRYIYIPATRNVEDFRRTIFTELIASAIQRVSRSRQKIKLIEEFYEDVRQQIAGVEETLTQELKAFLPAVNSIEFNLEALELDQLINVQDVEINDGALTSLRQKGDGFKSLFVISMLQFIAKQQFGKNLVFGIEEPEAHLHPSAIYRIKETLRQLSQSFQTVITTHSPILIQRDDLRSNIIVQQVPSTEFASSASPAKRLSDIRQSLGIRPQDNMTTAEVVIVVEGSTEEVCFGPLMAHVAPELTEAINTGRVRVLAANGASNVIAVVRALARDAANSIVFLDSDNEGDVASKAIANSGLIHPEDMFQVPKRQGCQETEFEDIFAPELYMESISTECGIAITAEMFVEARQRSGGRQTKMKKWSNIMASIASDCGKNWEMISDTAKEAFADAVVKNVSAIDMTNLVWLRSIAGRVRTYLAEG